MVRLEHVNKFFNRRKKNEIHVINDTTLQMESKGLVALLGPSGCGKTTLLNVIGGLDKVGSGNVYINGQKLTGRRAGKVDQIRNLNVGYIFQNYNLVDSMTVFDNVAIALKMVGVKDKKEIEEKVNYVLEKVGMYRYRNRYADMLSGGERQRVGIARAIVKNPAIVIADEPTGNLDSKNTLEVMNIIKAISEDKLVILVTHEEQLAEFYASRIIRILDGKVISDEINDHADNLDYRIENKIYLKDIPDHKRLKTDLYNLDFYNENGGTLDLDIVIRNGNIYIRTNNENDRLEIVDENSSIELVDDHYRKLSREDSMENSFDPQRLAVSGVRKYHSILNPWTMIKRGFKTVFNYNILKKILLLGFLISAIFITYSISNIFGVLNITDDEFVQEDKSYLTIIGKKIDVDTYLKYEADPDYDYVMPGDSDISMSMPYEDYLQTSTSNASLSGSLSDYKKLSVSDLAYGELPKNAGEIVVDRMVLKSVIRDQESKAAGFGTVESFLGQKVTVPEMPDMKIVGISDLGSPCIYTDQSIFINLIANAQSADEIQEGNHDTGEVSGGSGEGASGAIVDYNLKASSVSLAKGNWPTGDYEVLVNEKNKDDMAIGKTIAQKVNGKKLKVSGYYKDANDSDFMLVNSNTVKYNVIRGKANITVCPKDKKAALRQLNDEKINVKDTYGQSEKEYKKEKWASIFSTLILAGVILAISFIEIFLIIRASFLSRVKEVGVYRAIGVKKNDIYRMFAGEILAITTMASLPGFLLMAYILDKVSQISYFSKMFLIDPTVLGISLVLIYGFNLVFGLLPVFRTIRKTPAAILSRTDIN
ncbi:MAG: ABC transporter ATP-binding protein/permease [Firmicutes bacterium]|uniref:ABC transporter ATP-binding protein/permease n=1 Tax=Lentihominibacter sp. TaxID=2944216 RepID=UPI002A585050|nr:ABC transporter ATP-binding protein/permease [Lentihominibacter sp.]MCI5852633.1 ABC transporter ATP-binding protein/permease [Clostridiales bacterium]MDD7320753.1 ABC transporter ATP-binding protein/permease [Bacillota bacterium]MDY5287923.1 ABC transporter ATP-binding protein/permease [Lentihominibacter sp.]